MNQQMSQKQLLQWINMVSFAVNDITLYLDTHPDDEEALNYLKHYKELRKQGLRAYADQYGPLTIDSAKVGDHWDWATHRSSCRSTVDRMESLELPCDTFHSVIRCLIVRLQEF